MGGLIAKKMGLPVKKFVVATNANDEVPEYFKRRGIQPPMCVQRFGNGAKIHLNATGFAPFTEMRDECTKPA